jgi:hypothetical protein
MAIITKNSNTPSAVPTAGQLQVGELAVNTADGNLYTKSTDGSVKRVATASVKSISELVSKSAYGVVNVLNYHSDLEGGGGVFYWDATGDATEHNGGTVISPLATFPADWNNQTQLATWFDGSGLVGTGVWRRQYDGAVNVKWFGAKGDGVSDDTKTIQASLYNNGSSTVDGEGGTYRVNSGLMILSNTAFQHANIDFSNAPNTGKLFTSEGEVLATPLLTSNALAGDFILVFDTNGVVADDWIYVKSNELYSPLDTPTMGEFARVKTVDSPTQVTLYAALLYSYSTSNAASVEIISYKKNITLKKINAVGSGGEGNQFGFLFNYAQNIHIEECEFSKFDNRSGDFYRSLGWWVTDSIFSDSRETGLAYGVVANRGSTFGFITNNEFWNQKHAIATGGTDGVNRFITVSNNKIYATGGGIDNHAPCEYFTATDNHIQCSGDGATVSPYDAINLNSRTCMVTGNTIVSGNRNGIWWKPSIPAGYAGQGIISNNIFESNVNNTVYAGIQVGNSEDGSISQLIISGNIVNGFGRSIYVTATSSSQINNFSITGNSIGGKVNPFINAVYVSCDNTSTIQNGVIANNNAIVGSSGTDVIRILETSGGTIENLSITGNIVLSNGGTSAGINVFGDRSIIVSENIVRVGGVAYANSASTWQTITNAAGIVRLNTQSVVCNRSGTITLTLPSASNNTGRTLSIKTVQAQSVVSASPNVVPVNDTVAGTAILPATDGASVLLKSDGTNWVVF